MKRKQAILILIIFGVIIFVDVIYFNFFGERSRLISRALYAQKRFRANYRPSKVENFFDSLRKDYDPGYWSAEYDRIGEELISKGYFVKREFELPRKQFREVWINLFSDAKEDRLMLYSYSPYEPNDPIVTIYLIGPPETVNKKMEILKEISDTNEIN